MANGCSRIPCQREIKYLVHDCGSAFFVICRSGSSIPNKIWMRIQIMDPDLALNPWTENREREKREKSSCSSDILIIVSNVSLRVQHEAHIRDGGKSVNVVFEYKSRACIQIETGRTLSHHLMSTPESTLTHVPCALCNPMPESTLPPSQGLRIWPQKLVIL